MTAPVTPIAAERAFIEATAEKFMKEDIAAAAPEVVVPVVPPASDAAKPSAPDPEIATPDEEPVTPSATPDDDDAADDPDQDPESPDVDDEDEIDEEFAAAAKLNKVALTVDDLPEAARPLVKKRIKELETGFTKAMQDARDYRKDEAKFKAEERYRAENTAEYVADMLLKDPKLGEAVNALLDGITTETAKKAHEIVVREGRSKALHATEAQLKAQEDRAQRGLALDAYTRTQAMKAGVPLELGVEASVIAFINEKGDITEREIDAIVAQKAKEYANHTRAIRREASKKYVENKVEARKTGGLKVKPGSGITPAPSGKPRPKNDAEFMESFTARM